jgi:hypothetical protein
MDYTANLLNSEKVSISIVDRRKKQDLETLGLQNSQKSSLVAANGRCSSITVNSIDSVRAVLMVNPLRAFYVWVAERALGRSGDIKNGLHGRLEVSMVMRGETGNIIFRCMEFTTSFLWIRKVTLWQAN